MEITGGNGGLHGALKNIRRNDVYIIDVDSFYPSIMVNYSLYPKCRRQGRFAELLKMKREGLKEAKLMINSVYGLCPEDIRIKICKRGQELMHELIRETGGELIQVNTDGLIVKGPCFDAVDKWCIKHCMTVTCYHIKSLVQKDVNNYMYIDDNDNVVIKGTLKKQGIAGKAVAKALLIGASIDAETRNGSLLDYCEVLDADMYEIDGISHVCDFVRYIHTTDDTSIIIDHVVYNHCMAVMGNLSAYDIKSIHIDYNYYTDIGRRLYTDWTGRKTR